MTLDTQPYQENRFTTHDGLLLYFRDYGVRNENIPVICLPGLSRNSRDFDQFAQQIASDSTRPRRAITMDYRGRGLSDHDPKAENYNIVAEAGDVIALMDHLGLPQAHFIGTSRGGLILHIMATFALERISSIIFNDIGPEIELAGLRQIRDYLSAWPEPKSWDQAARALKATHGEGFPVFDNDDWMDMAKAIFSDRKGVISPDYDPALVAPLKTMDLSGPLPDLWEQFELLANIPTLAIRGENSILLSTQTLETMKQRHNCLEICIALGQAHAPILHGHGPEIAVADFLRQRD